MKKAILFALILGASAAVAQPPIKAKAMSTQLVSGANDTIYLTYFQDSTEMVHQFALKIAIKAGETVEVLPDGVKYNGKVYQNHFQALKTPKQ